MPEDGDEESPVSPYQDTQSLALPCRGLLPVSVEKVRIIQPFQLKLLCFGATEVSRVSAHGRLNIIVIMARTGAYTGLPGTLQYSILYTLRNFWEVNSTLGVYFPPSR